MFWSLITQGEGVSPGSCPYLWVTPHRVEVYPLTTPSLPETSRVVGTERLSGAVRRLPSPSLRPPYFRLNSTFIEPQFQGQVGRGWWFPMVRSLPTTPPVVRGLTRRRDTGLLFVLTRSWVWTSGETEGLGPDLRTERDKAVCRGLPTFLRQAVLDRELFTKLFHLLFSPSRRAFPTDTRELGRF